jgi:uncharacterized spore protein YtfJ
MSGERAAVGPTADFLGRLTEVVRSRAGVSAVYGEPVEAAGVTVVPVSRVRFVVGGGLGAGERMGEGGGGGAGVSAVPVGYLEIRDGTAVYRPIRRPLLDLLRPAILLAAVALVRRRRASARR